MKRSSRTVEDLPCNLQKPIDVHLSAVYSISERSLLGSASDSEEYLETKTIQIGGLGLRISCENHSSTSEALVCRSGPADRGAGLLV